MGMKTGAEEEHEESNGKEFKDQKGYKNANQIEIDNKFNTVYDHRLNNKIIENSSVPSHGARRRVRIDTICHQSESQRSKEQREQSGQP